MRRFKIGYVPHGTRPQERTLIGESLDKVALSGILAKDKVENEISFHSIKRSKEVLGKE